LLAALLLTHATLAAEPTPLSAADLAITRSAFDAAERGDWVEAEAIAATARDTLPKKLIRWADDIRPDGGHAFQEIADFAEANPDWPQQNQLRVRAEDQIATVSDDTLRAWFAKEPPISGFARLRALELSGTGTAGIEAQVREIWIDGDYSEEEESTILARYSNMLRPADHIRRLDRLLWDNKSAEAARMLSRVPDDWRLLAEARMKLAAGAKGADAAVAKVPASLAGDPGLAFERAHAKLRKNADAAALSIMLAQSELGRPEGWWADRQMLARRLLQQNRADEAYRLVADNRLTDRQKLTDAEFTAGWIALRFLRDPARAAPHFARLTEAGKMPLTLSRGAYWAGRAADALGRRDEAAQWYQRAAQYPTTYYGQLAAAMPGVLPPDTPAPEPKASPAELAAFEQKELVRAVRLLNAIGEPDRMKPFLWRLVDLAKAPADFALIADLAEAIGRPDLGVSAAKKASYAGVTLLRAGYPIVWTPRNAGTEQALLLALARQESAFELRALSPSGARGLMQLMPGTAKEVAAGLALPYSNEKLITDGVFNVTLGQAYFDTLVAQFNGSYVLSVAAYNAGPGRVEQWIDQFGDPRQPGVDPVDWVESIPFSETRNYVQRVLENLQVYRLRIGDPSLAFSLEADLRR
jgi:soluble lytic murein transglycosylase